MSILKFRQADPVEELPRLSFPGEWNQCALRCLRELAAPAPLPAVIYRFVHFVYEGKKLHLLTQWFLMPVFMLPSLIISFFFQWLSDSDGFIAFMSSFFRNLGFFVSF